MKREDFLESADPREKKLVREILNVISIGSKRDPCIDDHLWINEPFELFHQRPSASDLSSSELRKRTVFRLMHRLLQCKGDGFEKITFRGSFHRDIERNCTGLLRMLYSAFRMERGEILAVVMINYDTGALSVFQGKSNDIFGCKAEIDLLKKRIKLCSPCSIMMVHSHPGAITVVSEADLDFTNAISSYAASLGSSLVEHYVTSCLCGPYDAVGIIGNNTARKD